MKKSAPPTSSGFPAQCSGSCSLPATIATTLTGLNDRLRSAQLKWNFSAMRRPRPRPRIRTYLSTEASTAASSPLLSFPPSCSIDCFVPPFRPFRQTLLSPGSGRLDPFNWKAALRPHVGHMVRVCLRLEADISITTRECFLRRQVACPLELPKCHCTRKGPVPFSHIGRPMCPQC